MLVVNIQKKTSVGFLGYYVISEKIWIILIKLHSKPFRLNTNIKTLWFTKVVEQANSEVLAVFRERVVAFGYLLPIENPADHVLDGIFGRIPGRGFLLKCWRNTFRISRQYSNDNFYPSACLCKAIEAL